LAREFDHDDGEGEQDQRFEMVVHSARQTGCFCTQLFQYGFATHPVGVTGRRGFSRAKFKIGRDRHKGELQRLEEACEGENGEVWSQNTGLSKIHEKDGAEVIIDVMNVIAPSINRAS